MNDLTGWFIAACWVVFVVYVLIAAFSVKRTVLIDKRWNWNWLVFIVVVVVLFLLRSYEAPLWTYADEATLWPRTLALSIGTDVLALAGLIIALAGRVALGRNWNINPGLKADHELIERGPYAYVRHPMYTGLLLMLLGTVVWYGTWAGFIIFIACFFGTWFKLSQEEKMLTEHFGKNYTEYKARVKALIPFAL